MRLALGLLALAGWLLALAGAHAQPPTLDIPPVDTAPVDTAPVVDIAPVVETESLEVDVDDPAIWVNRASPAASLIVGTIKSRKPAGGLAVYSLDGKLVERAGDLDRPNNVDILGDLCVTTERLARQLRFYRVHATKPHLRPLGTLPVFVGQAGEFGAPMGVALYRRAQDGALFAMVSRKTGPRVGYLWQYRLHLDPAGVRNAGIRGEKVREFGTFSGQDEIEAVAVDQRAALVYYSDESCCIRVWRADPDAAGAASEVARFGETGFRANREGIAIAGDVVIVTDQLDPRSEYHVYRRSDRRKLIRWRGLAQSTDGIDATDAPLGPRFPRGLLVVMNNARRNFQLYRLP